MAYNTGNPIGSDAVEDFVDNIVNLDHWSVSTGATFTDRFGNSRATLAGMTAEAQQQITDAITALGWNPVAGDFTTGATLTNRNDILWYPAGSSYYSWLGALPKVVAPASTPIGDSNWVDRTDGSLRTELASGGSSITEISTLKSDLEAGGGTIAEIASLKSDLAADTGGQLIGFKSAGTGAVSVLLDGKLKETISVKDFGAVGDGVTDDAAAVQAALDYASTISAGAKVIFPYTLTGYKLDSGISIDVSTTIVDFCGTLIDFSGMTTGNAISFVRTEADANLQNTIHHAHPASNGMIKGPGAGVVVTCIYINDAGNNISGGCVKNLSIRDFESDLYLGNGAFCWEFDHCNFTTTAGSPGGYSIEAAAGSNSGERISFIGCMWNNRNNVLLHNNPNGNMFFVNCSIDYSPTRVMTINAGAVFVTNSHIEQSSDADYWFVVDAANALLDMSDSDIIVQVDKTAYAPFFSGTACVTGGVSMHNVRLTGSFSVQKVGIVDGFGRTAISNVMEDVSYGGSQVSQHQNAVVYGTFENGLYTSEWTLTNGAIRSSAQAHTDTYSLSLPASSGVSPKATVTVDCKPEQMFRGGLWYKISGITGTSATFSVNVAFLDAYGNQLSSYDMLLATSDVASWTFLPIGPHALTSRGTSKAKLNLEVFGVVSGTPTAYIDDVVACAV